jgi:hypothetical protein
VSPKTTPTGEKTPEMVAIPESPAEKAPVAHEDMAEQTEEAPASALGTRLNDITIPEIKALLSEVGTLVKYSTPSPGDTGGKHNVTIINIAVQIGNNHLDSGVGNAPYNFTDPSTHTVTVTEEEED